PTTNRYAAAPSNAIAPVIAKAQKKLPVFSTTKPARIGPEIPARFPQKFSRPVHLPEVLGPARICVLGQRFGGHNHQAMHESPNRPMASVASATNSITTKPRPAIASAPAPSAFSTTVGLRPALMAWSAYQPAKSTEMPSAKKAAPTA